MCGIFGVVLGEGINSSPSSIRGHIDTLFKLSQSRGKEAAGCAIRSPYALDVYKRPLPASEMIASEGYKKFITRSLKNAHGALNTPLAVIGHSRLVTNGAQEVHDNNQPVIKGGLVGVHNGIIVNADRLWKQFPHITQSYEVDTEVLLELIRLFFAANHSIEEATRKSFRIIEGSASIGVLFDDLRYLLLATNTGSLYTWISNKGNAFFFASELFILKTFLEKHNAASVYGTGNISQAKPGCGLLVSLFDLQVRGFQLFDEARDHASLEPPGATPVAISDAKGKLGLAPSVIVTQHAMDWSIHEEFLASAKQKIDGLKRCTKCILPETFPFIVFDEDGVCNYCHNYMPLNIKGKAALDDLVKLYRGKKGELDCIVSFSGGRDSSYGLHYVKKVLGMNPIAFSYDWGMITDLGRRNQARLCGKLGVEHILVSADIKKKRAYIRKNVEAWLRKPDLGIIPLFMAGDKQYFYYANTLMRQYGIKILVMAENQLERAHFKHGFSGIRPKDINDPAYFMNVSDKIKLVAYYGRQYLSNPSYINASLIDTAGAFISYYMIPHNYLYLFNYIRWDEHEIADTLINEYDWELASDTTSTWRIGDGTAAFYNYIYFIVAGFTEIDTFRSNQIREGMISRDTALDLARNENKPRFESIEWYAQTIGFDCERAIRIINTIPKRYSLDG